MNTSRNVFFAVFGAAIGFSIETLGVVGAPWIASLAYENAGVVLNVDGFLFFYPLMLAVAVSAVLYILTKRLPLSLGVVVGFALAVALFSFALRGI
jgi:hypothetical protein